MFKVQVNTEHIDEVGKTFFQMLSYLKESPASKRLKKQQRKTEGFTYHKLQFSLYVCPVKNLCPFLSQVPERRQRGAV